MILKVSIWSLNQIRSPLCSSNAFLLLSDSIWLLLRLFWLLIAHIPLLSSLIMRTAYVSTPWSSTFYPFLRGPMWMIILYQALKVHIWCWAMIMMMIMAPTSSSIPPGGEMIRTIAGWAHLVLYLSPSLLFLIVLWWVVPISFSCVVSVKPLAAGFVRQGGMLLIEAWFEVIGMTHVHFTNDQAFLDTFRSQLRIVSMGFIKYRVGLIHKSSSPLLDGALD